MQSDEGERRMPLNSPPLFDPLRFVEPSTSQPRDALIAEIAYFKSQRRNFQPGHEKEDWLAAEAEVDARFKGRVVRPQSGPRPASESPRQIQ
jgi:hypothetical protein